MAEEHIGKYALVSKIADGGMAEVYLAETGGVGGFAKRVALKKILPYFTSDDAFVHSFINEARICGQLHHPNLVEVYGFDRNEDVYYLAMEYIDGLDLERILAHRRMRQEAFPIAVACALILQVLDGLDYAHRAHSLDGKPLRIIHRDMKPSNILIDRSGVIKIVDFGIAKASSNIYKTRDLGTAKGTVGYMSPEQATGSADLEPSSDLFSVGIIFYELLTLRRLFEGKNVFAILESVRTADVQAQLSELKALPPGLLRVLRKALSKDLSQRYPSAQAMIRDLRQVSPADRGHDLLAKFIVKLTKQGLSPLHTAKKNEAGRPGMGANAPGEEIQLRTRILDAKALEEEAIRASAQAAGLVDDDFVSEETRPLPERDDPDTPTFTGYDDGDEGPDTVRDYGPPPEGAIPPSMLMKAKRAEAQNPRQPRHLSADDAALRTAPGGPRHAPNRPPARPPGRQAPGRRPHREPPPAPPLVEKTAETQAKAIPPEPPAPPRAPGQSARPSPSQEEVTGKTVQTRFKVQDPKRIAAFAAMIVVVLAVAGAYFFKPKTTDIYITIESQPPGAQVFVDDALALRTTPGQIMLTLSEAKFVELVLEKEGYEPFVQSAIPVSPKDYDPKNPLTFHFTLTSMKKVGSLYLATSPPGAQVFIDGQETDYFTPVTITDIPVGPHALVLKRPGHEDATVEVEIVEGEQNVERALSVKGL